MGRLVGNLASMFQGGSEVIGAGGAEVLTVGAATVPAAMVAVHGGGVTAAGTVGTGKEIMGLVNYFAKKGHGSAGDNFGKNSRKMTLDEIESFLGKNWHQNGAKTKFLNKFKKQLRGDTNADFCIDKATNEVLLKSNRSGVWVKTGEFLN